MKDVARLAMLVTAPLALASGCADYTSADNQAFLQLYGNELSSVANSNAARQQDGAGTQAELVALPDVTQTINPVIARCPDAGELAVSGSVTSNIDPRSGNGYVAVALDMRINGCTANGFSTQGSLTFTGNDTVTGGHASPPIFQLAGAWEVSQGGNVVKSCTARMTVSAASGWNGYFCDDWFGPHS